MKKSFLMLLSIMALLLMIPAVSIGSSILIGDESGNIATVDTDTGVASGLFNTGIDYFTDIAYDPLGNLWGITFDDLYSIDVVSGSAAHRGSLGSSIYFNALTFGSDGTAYAMGNLSDSLYTVDLGTGTASAITGIDLDLYSHGDLAFDNTGFLYLSGTLTSGVYGDSRLVKIDLSTKGSTDVGSLGIDNVFGLAFTDGIMFGAAGTEIFEIDLSTGKAIASSLTPVQGGLSVAYGASQTNPVPEPATMLLLGTGLAALAGFRRKFSHS